MHLAGLQSDEVGTFNSTMGFEVVGGDKLVNLPATCVGNLSPSLSSSQHQAVQSGPTASSGWLKVGP